MATPLVFINVLSTPQTNWEWNILAASGANLFGGQQKSTGVRDAETSYDFYAQSGTYTLDLYNAANTDAGIYTVEIDGLTVGTIDGYNASLLSRKSSLTGIALSSTGVHRVRLVMEAKNASSSSYRGAIHAISLTRTGA